MYHEVCVVEPWKIKCANAIHSRCLMLYSFSKYFNHKQTSGSKFIY